VLQVPLNTNQLTNLLCTGCKAERLACSNTNVYVLDTAGELMVRLGVSAPSKHWHKVPGALNTFAGNYALEYLCVIG